MSRDWQDVKLVADQIKIPTTKVNFVQEYWDDVFVYFLEQYHRGRTPNPDVLCNRKIKFHQFYQYAKNHLKADYIAMGHYAQIRFNDKYQEYELLRAVDRQKDQTYFLSRLSQSVLAKIQFPIGHLLKSEVRRIAEQARLSVAHKKDSTGICFVGERNFSQFLAQYLPHQPGPIVDITNNTQQGRHQGVMYYTIGQNKNLNLGGKPEAYYVVGKDVATRTLYIAPKSQKAK